MAIETGKLNEKIKLFDIITYCFLFFDVIKREGYYWIIYERIEESRIRYRIREREHGEITIITSLNEGRA